jgi:tetratricopeptide (TPR) repeat protein
MTKPGRAGNILCFLLFFYVSVSARPAFRFTPGCTEAQQHIRCLRLEKARILLRAERAADPENVAVDYLENAVDFYYLLASQQPSELKRLEKQKDPRLNRIRKSDPSSPYYLYAQSEIILQWAFARVFSQEFVTAAWEIRNAYQIIEENSKKHPGFLPDLKNMGLIKTVLGTVPENYRWALKIAGMSGNYEEGLAMIRKFLNDESLASQQPVIRQSAEFYYTLLLLNFGDKKECWNFCKKVTADHQQNLMSCYLRGFVAMKTAHNDEAVSTLLGRPSTPEYTPFVALDYFLGGAKLNRLDKDADVYLKRFVTFNKGENLVKDAYKKLSWFYLLQQDTQKFNIYRGLSRKYGAITSDEDRNAQKEAESGILPDAELLRARLLFDGGYYSRAEEVMESINAASLKTEYQKIEYHYRYGRIMHEAGKIPRALEEYHRVVKISGNSGYYFAPNACLQLGYIYEHLGYRDLARDHFEQAIAYRGYEYRSSVTQKAKVALNRLK